MKTAMMTSNDRGSLAGRDIVDLVHQRNEQLRQAFATLLAADGPAKATLFDELVTILAVREAVAQELIRPSVVRPGPVAPAEHIRTAEQQPEVVTGLSLLSSMDVEDDTFDAEMTGVARRVILHLDTQERVDLPLLRRSLPAEELHALAGVLLCAEAVAGAPASAVQTETTSPDALGMRDVLGALGEMCRGAKRP